MAEDVNILFAEYVYADYEGSAFVLFEQAGKLFEVYGSHCSCYGLEGQWEPEASSIDLLTVKTGRGASNWEAWLKEYQASTT